MPDRASYHYSTTTSIGAIDVNAMSCFYVNTGKVDCETSEEGNQAYGSIPEGSSLVVS